MKEELVLCYLDENDAITKTEYLGCFNLNDFDDQVKLSSIERSRSDFKTNLSLRIIKPLSEAG